MLLNNVVTIGLLGYVCLYVISCRVIHECKVTVVFSTQEVLKKRYSGCCWYITVMRWGMAFWV
jgi:hypothetical protein